MVGQWGRLSRGVGFFGSGGRPVTGPDLADVDQVTH
jgi:hypothetical protein